jgi:hypothetical protein
MYRFSRNIAGSFVFFVVLLASFGTLKAQVAGTGSIQGTIADPTGAVIPNAAVVITQDATRVQHAATTDSGGAYVFPNIDVGTYSVKVTAPGFETYTKTGNVLEVGSSIAINVTMTVGRQDQTVEVKSDGLALQTEDVSFKQTVDSQTLTEMPLNGRQMTSLITLSGGSAPAPGGDFTGSKYSYATIPVSIAGSAGNTTQWVLDGGDNNDYMANGNLPFPFPDAVSQFSVESTALGAQEGEHSGGLVNVVTRSGTNTYHGSAFEFIRNNYLDATNFFTTCTPIAPATTCSAKDTLHQNQYGGTFGGKILRDKLFAFAGYQHTKADQSQAPTTAFVPSAANLNGDFSASDPSIKLVNPLTGAALTNNMINPALFNPQALALVKYLPTTTAANGSVSYQIPSQTADNQFVTRVDWTLNPKNNLYGRYFIDGYQAPAFYSPTNILITTQSGNSERVQSFTLGEDYALSSKVVNSAHITLSRRRNNRGYAPNDINASNLGVTDFQAVPNGLYLAVTNKFTIGGGTNSVSKFNDNFLAVEDDVTMLRGKHQIVFGGEIVHNQLNISNAYETNGVFTFGGNYSANGPNGGKLAGDNNLDFLLGAMSAFQQSKYQGNALRGNVPSLYLQDTYHATKQLTVVAGIRWSPEYIPVDTKNRGTTFNMAAFLANQVSTVYPTAPAGTFFYGDPGVPRQFTKNSPDQFSPNVGLAYDVDGKGKTVIRAGAEFIYDEVNFFTGQRTQQNPPFATAISQTQTATSGPISFSNPWSVGSITSDPFPQPAIPTAANAQFFAQSQYIVLPTQFKPSSTTQWTLSVQHQFRGGWELQLDYIGNKTSHVPLGVPLSPAVYIPGTQNAAGTGCGALALTGPAGKPAAAGTACSTVANQSQRFLLTTLNPAQGNQYLGGGGGSVMVGDEGTGNYNGLVTTVQRRLSHNFSLLFNHTWSKCLNEEDAQGDLAGTTVENPNNPALDYAPCGQDYRNIENVVIVAQSNFGIANHLLKTVVNGWEFAPLVHILSGSDFTVTAGVDNSLTDVGNDRPNLIPGVTPYLGTPLRSSAALGQATRGYLNPLAFCSQTTTANPCTNVVASGTYGTASRNEFRGPTAYNFDAQISRVFPIHERLTTTLRLEAFNVLNHPNFSNPTSALSSSTFGQISNTSNAARVFQGSVKFTF